MTRKRILSCGVVLGLLLVSCGSSNLSMSEYGDRLESIRMTHAPRAEAAWVAFLGLPDPTMRDLKALADSEVAIRVEIEEAIRALDAPDEMLEFNELLADWTAAMREAGTALAARAEVSGGWGELLQSSEYQEFATTLTGGAEVCNDFQAKLDATKARGVFADTPWIPAELKDVADAVIGCETIPEDLDVVFGR
ncbi:MAG: hypothetical protein GY720_11750 [bacterium]|nr:hypothetical protein [bacterium]